MPLATQPVKLILLDLSMLGHFHERRSQIFCDVAKPHHKKSGIFFFRDHLESHDKQFYQLCLANPEQHLEAQIWSST